MQDARASFLAMLATLSLASAMHAGRIENVDFPPAVQVGKTRLSLVGLGLMRYRWVFKAFVGAIYVEEQPDRPGVLADAPKRLEIHYFWSLSGADLGKAADAILAENFSAEALAPLRARIARFHSAYRDVKPGDRYSLTYIPGEGTTLALNGRALATAPGADFAAAYFSIWFGEKPMSVEFKRQLLSGVP